MIEYFVFDETILAGDFSKQKRIRNKFELEWKQRISDFTMEGIKEILLNGQKAKDYATFFAEVDAIKKEGFPFQELVAYIPPPPYYAED